MIEMQGDPKRHLVASPQSGLENMFIAEYLLSKGYHLPDLTFTRAYSERHNEGRLHLCFSQADRDRVSSQVLPGNRGTEQ